MLLEERNSCRLEVGFVRTGDRAQFGSLPDLELEMFAGKFLARIEVPGQDTSRGLVERDGGLTCISLHPVCICLPDRDDRLSEIDRTWWIEDYPVWIDILCSNLEVRSRIGC